jgi:hypothetical protein
MSDQTLNQAIAVRGWTTEPGTYGRKRVYDRSGDFVGELTASETWDALHDAEADELVEWANDQEDFPPDGRFEGIPRNWMGEPC